MGVFAVDVGVLAVAVGVVAVAVEVAVRAMVAVVVGVTSVKIPLPHPELGSMVKVNPTIVRRGTKRAIMPRRR